MTTTRALALVSAFILPLLSTPALAKPARPKPTISLDVYQADLQNVIRLLADVSGKNVVVSEDVKGRVTLKLKNVPWDQALDIILKANKLSYAVDGTVVRIAPIAVLAAVTIGGLIGLFQGWMIAYLAIPSFIVTLAGMLVFKGLALWLLGGMSVGPFPREFQLLSAGFIPDVLGVHCPRSLNA